MHSATICSWRVPAEQRIFGGAGQISRWTIVKSYYRVRDFGADRGAYDANTHWSFPAGMVWPKELATMSSPKRSSRGCDVHYFNYCFVKVKGGGTPPSPQSIRKGFRKRVFSSFNSNSQRASPLQFSPLILKWILLPSTA